MAVKVYMKTGTGRVLDYPTATKVDVGAVNFTLSRRDGDNNTVLVAIIPNAEVDHIDFVQ
jgi:hypothetical protein